MQARKSLNLPRPADLKSNKLKDIQDWLQRYAEEHDKQYRLMFQDINTIQVDIDNHIYFGGKNTEGSWRQGRDGNNFVTQRLESGVWVTKQTIIP
ncbi:MAG: hypothetical protein KAJ19_26875 [Gammaproteobacteria bacterium]|nr:hypothetical protein [Gammaproteobacteria bacterium]